MGQAAGIVVHVSASRSESLLNAYGIYGNVAEAVPQFSHSRNLPLVVFLCLTRGKVTHLGDARRGMRAAHDMSRINITKLVELPSPIAFTSVVACVPARVRARVEAVLRNGGLLPPRSFEAVVTALQELSPTSHQVLKRFAEVRRRRIAGLERRASRSLAFQKETVATALALAGLARDELQAWSPKTDDPPASFLDGLPSARLREDPMIINDLMQVPGFEQIKAMPYGAALFEGEGVRLTVVLANRLPLEQQLGADLLYYNETFKSFVIIQYKAMDRSADGKAYFRIPDAQLTAELERMDETLLQLAGCPPDNEPHGFRLHQGPFYLKLCPRLVFNPDDMGLTKGMYLPLDYWRLLEADKGLRGPGGGKRITYENVGRYFSNDGFIDLVAKAWIGTTITQSAIVAEIIRVVLSSGRALAVAVRSTAAAPDDMAGADADPVVPGGEG